MHLDGTIDSDTYRTKLQEYKKRQQEITFEMLVHIDSDEICLITAKTVFDLAKNSRAIFESSNLDEKQQLLRFVFSNLRADGENLHLELREPFSTMSKIENQPDWLGRKDSNLRMPVPKTGALPLGYAPT